MIVEFEYLKKLSLKGGPRQNQYEELSDVFASINYKRKIGAVDASAIEECWRSIPDVFYSLDTMQGFTILRPYGYAGDFEIIERIYKFWKSPKDNLVNWDNFAHSQIASQAVRNRKDYFLNLLYNLHATKKQKRVLNIASGPARGIVEFLSMESGGILFECVDCDKNAIEYSSKQLTGFNDYVEFHTENAFYFSSQHTFDLVWSAGLFDYLNDRAFKLLIKKLLKFLGEEGELVIGNFSPSNPSRDYMEFGNWYLNYRSIDALTNLAKEIGVPEEKISVQSEPLGVNLFLHISK